MTQRDLAARLEQRPSYVAKIELSQRRLDLVELIDILAALRCDGAAFLAEFITGPAPRAKRKPRSADH